MYDPGYEGESVFFPQYGSADYLSAEELRHVKAMYAGGVTLADRWFGHLMDTVANLGLLENTAIVVTSDHGHLFGDHGVIGKPGIRSGPDALLWEGIADIPLLVYAPHAPAGRRSSALVQAVDLYPTLLDAAGVACPGDVDGHSLLPLLTVEQERVREIGVYGRHGDTVNVTDGRYTLFLHHPDRHPGQSRMFDLQQDPRQQVDILSRERALAHEFQAYAVGVLKRRDASEAVLETARHGLEW
jgi:arylsulfatase A-like enzyme